MIEKALTPDYFWRSLWFFCLYRLLVATFLLVVAVGFSDVVSIGSHDLKLFLRSSAVYVALAVGFIVMIRRRAPDFSAQLTLQILVDVAMITLLLYASGGQKSGLAVLLLISLAGAGLVGEGRMVLFFAAIASVAMLLEQALRTLRLDADPGDFLRTGLICLSFFGMAISARLLAKRVVANEELARSRGEALDRQLSIGKRIIADMTDGVLVLDERGQLQQSNATAQRLLQIKGEHAHLRDWSPHLARQMQLDADARRDLTEVMRARDGKLLRFRLLPGAERGGDSVVYVEDMERIQIQAQQLKLAALGRLTANIAHEVRNPLASISHAAELLAEDESDPVKRRLAVIVGDNAARLNRLVTDVLELGGRDRATREKLGWQEVSAQFIEEFSLHDQSATNRLVANSAAARFYFDRGHLHRVLWNLVANAMRHASNNQGAVQLDCVRAETTIALHVRDDGPGIPEDVERQIFEPFVTSHGSGTGLGLYIARELCEANNARLELLSPDEGDTEGVGAHFVILMEAAP